MIPGRLKPGEPLGPYRLIHEVGAGSYGVVWEARDPLDRRIALKIPRTPAPTLHAQLTEARHQARLDHENIIRVYGVEQVQDLVLIAMEFADGGSLRQRLDTRRIDWREVQRHGQSLCRALAAAHGQGIVHGDLKPENILFSAGGIIKVTDFGLSALIGLPAGQSGGSIAYMAPERFDGTLEPQADLWSLGVVLYESITGHLPFDGETPAAMIEKIRKGNPPPIRAPQSDVPEALADIILRLLGREPRARTASRVLEELSRLETRSWQGAATALASTASGTTPTMPETAIRKLLHRRSAWRGIRAHPAAAVGVLALAAAGFTYATWTPSRQGPENAGGHFASGLSHARSSRNGKAIEEIGKALALDPGNIRYRRALALLYEEAALGADAAREWRTILQLDPAHAEARDMLERLAAPGSLRERTGDGRPQTGHETDRANGTP